MAAAKRKSGDVDQEQHVLLGQGRRDGSDKHRTFTRETAVHVSCETKQRRFELHEHVNTARVLI